ncbi:hypothetical protein M3Y96_01013200 [Aphelenchoides besseyi]|nr:hypothetical protein M3Y96_01013200 [Aphelenchoides besseyi]
MTANPKLTTIEGEPLNIVKLENEEYVFDTNLLVELLEQNENADENICVLNVVGKLRMSKCFLLTCFIRYLEWLEAGSPADVDWYNIPCEGFMENHNPKRETIGVYVWPK